MTPGEPEIDAALDLLRRLAGAASASVETFAISREADHPPLLLRVLFDDPLQTEFLEAVRGKAADLVDRTPRAYRPAAELSRGEVMYVEAGVGLLATLESALATGDADLYDPEADYVNHLRLMVTRVTLDDSHVVSLYRELRPTARLDRSRLFAAFWSDGRYNKIVEEHVLLFDRNFDAVVTGGIAFFTSKSVFERIFDFVAEMQRSARATFAAITAGLQIEGIDKLEAAATSNPAMMAKMASIQRRLDSDPAYRAAMTMDKLVAYVRAHPETGVEITGSGVTAKLHYFPDPRRRFKILRLLDDDYLASELTNRTYEANSKGDPL